MKYGVIILPEFAWAEARGIWQQVETMGFDHAWTYDHLAWRNLRDSAWYGTIPTLSAAALATQTIRLGTLVASPHFRHPVKFSKELMTIDDLSAGRLTIGIGAGGSGWDKDILGQAALALADKTARFEEFVKLLDRLLRVRMTDWQGRFYTAKDVRTLPGCVQQPRIPFAIAATGKRGMTLAALFGALWVTTGDRSAAEPLDAKAGAQAVKEQMSRLDAICETVGRDPSTLRRLVVTGPSLQAGLKSLQAFDDTVGAYAEIGVTDYVVHRPRPTPPFEGNLKTFKAIISQRLS